MSRSYKELFSLDKDEIELIETLCNLCLDGYRTTVRELLRKRLRNSISVIFKLSEANATIKGLCLDPSFKSIYIYYIQDYGKFEDLPLSMERLYELVKGYYLWDNYLKFPSDQRNSENAQELLDKACECHVFHALRERCYKICNLLRELPNADGWLELLIKDAVSLSRHHSVPGCVTAAYAYFWMGLYQEKRPNLKELAASDAQFYYIQGIKCIFLGKLQYATAEAQIHIDSAYGGEAGLNQLLDKMLPANVKRDWDSIITWSMANFNLKEEHYTLAQKQAEQELRQATPAISNQLRY